MFILFLCIYAFEMARRYIYIYKNKIVVVLAPGFMIICTSLQESLRGRSIYVYTFSLYICLSIGASYVFCWTGRVMTCNIIARTLMLEAFSLSRI